MSDPRPFDGIRVLDLSAAPAGAIAAMYIADFGGDVVAVDPGGEGPLAADPIRVYAGRNKRIMPMDVTAREGLGRLRRLARRADVVVVDGPLPFLNRFGLDATTMRCCNSQLLHVWMPAHGTVGRGSSLPADDFLLAARTGLADQQPATTDTPVFPVVPHLTYEQGALGAIAIAAGLVGRDRSGLGRSVTVSGLHAVSALNATILVDLPGTLRPFGGPKPGTTGGPSFRMYQCRDGRWLFVAALTPSFFEKVLDAMGLAGVMDVPGIDGDFLKLRDPERQRLVAAPVEARMMEKDRDDWLEIFDRAGVPSAPIERRGDWLESETVAANGALVRIHHADLGPVVLPGIPVELSITPGRVERLADSQAIVSAAELWADVPDYPRLANPRLGSRELPLAGLEVLDLGSFQAGPFASDILGDLGASVVKIEHPGGDGFRSAPYAYTALNKGKHNLSIDLKEEGALDVLLRLVRDADVLIDNVRVGIPERLGTHYEALRAANPGIVRCTITGWGEGPLRDSPCFDPLLQARSGLMAAQGGDAEPVLNAMPVQDVGVGTLAAFGAVAALFARRLVGRGQEVRTSLTHASLIQQAGEVTRFAGSPSPLQGGRDYLGPSSCRRLYRCADGWIALNAAPRGLEAVMAALAGAGPEADVDLDVDQLEQRLAGVSVEDALDALTAASMAAVKVLGRNDILEDGWLDENNFFAPVWDTEHGRMTIVTGYADWGRPRADQRAWSHALGEDAAAILREAGLPADAIAHRRR
jgi:crotonobetainyl-CoA:carnitine CoA-transferase CaiB-like acyl-CoA transferase